VIREGLQTIELELLAQREADPHAKRVTNPRMSKGFLEGDQMLPSAIAEIAHGVGWRDTDLVVAVAVCLAESQGFTKARCENYDTNGKMLTVDVGPWQINMPGAEISGDEFRRLQDPVYNARRAYRMWESRKWQPWVAFNTGVATNGNWWAFSVDKAEWHRTGRYLHRAIRGVANFHGKRFQIPTVNGIMVDFGTVPPHGAPPIAT